MDNNIAQLTVRFQEMEKSLRLFERHAQNIYFWPLLRRKVFRKIQFSADLGTHQAHGRIKKKNSSIRDFLKLLKPEKRRILVIPHSRRVEGIDIYTDHLIKHYNDDALVIETEGTINSSYQDSFSTDVLSTLSRFYRPQFLPAKVKKEIKTLSNLLQDEIHRRFNTRLPLEKMIIERTREFIILKKLYTLLFKYKNIEHIFAVTAYSFPYIIAAANDLKIPVYELQHGLISPYHLGYNYIDAHHIPYQPDKILLYGDYWKNSASFAPGVTPEVTGFPYLDNIKKIFKSEKTSNSIFVSSQFSTGPIIFDFVLNAAKILPEYSFTFSPHPREDINAYKNILSAQNNPVKNLRLLKCENVYEDIAKHEYQIGVASTTLFEGLTLGTKVVLLNLPGIEHAEPLYKKYGVPLVKTAEDLKASLKNYSVDLTDNDFYQKTDFKRYLDL